MFYLYLKTHNTTGLKYLGMTSKDPLVYQGSGKYWKSHIKKHGYDVTTVVIYETPFIEEIKEQGLYFSDLWNIVDSNEFANLVVESGDGVLLYKHTEETKRKIGVASKGRTFSEEAKRKIGAANSKFIGEKSSQYGSNSELKENKKIGKNEPIPDGWVRVEK